MTEAEFTDAVAEYARLRGHLVAHHRPARTNQGWRTAGSYDTQGFPDMVFARAGVVILAELKVKRRKPTDHQQAWIRESGAYLWTPDDWDEIEAVLR